MDSLKNIFEKAKGWMIWLQLSRKWWNLIDRINGISIEVCIERTHHQIFEILAQTLNVYLCSIKIIKFVKSFPQNSKILIWYFK